MNPIRQLSYKHKLLAISLILAIVPILVLGSVSVNLFSNKLQEEVDLHQQSILRQLQTQMDLYVAWMDQLSVKLASDSTVQRIADEGISMNTLEQSVQFMSEVQNVVANSNIPINVSVIMPRSNSVYSHRGGLNRQIDYPHSEIAKLLWTGSVTSYKIPPGTYQGQKDLLIIRPIPMNSSTPKGLLVLHLDTVKLVETIENTQLPLNRSLFVLDDKGRMIISGQTWSESRNEQFNQEIFRTLYETNSFPNKIEWASEQYFATSIVSASNGWTYVAVASAEELSAKADQIRSLSWTLVVLICILGGAVAVYVSRQLFNPLHGLANKFMDITRKDKGSDVLAVLDRTMVEMQQTNERLQHRLNEQMPIMKEHALLSLIRGGHLTGGPSVKESPYLAQLQGDWFCIGVVEIDQLADLKRSYSQTDQSLFMYALRSLIEETGEQYSPVLAVSSGPGQVVFLMGREHPVEETDTCIREFAECILKHVKQFFPFTISVSLSETRQGYETIAKSYQEAHSFLLYRLTMGPSVIILPEHTQSMNASLRDIIRMEREVVVSIVQGDYLQAGEKVNELLLEASRLLQRSDAIVGLLVHLVGDLDNSMQEFGVELTEVMKPDALGQIYSLSRLEELQSWMEQSILQPVKQHMEGLQIPKKKKSVQYTIALVQEQLETDLSLQQIADHIQIARPTLSKWFKEETGEDFREYLIRLRMQKAMEWLQNRDIGIKEIAGRLRYTSVPNFTRIFKQFTGFTPGAFRNQAEVLSTADSFSERPPE